MRAGTGGFARDGDADDGKVDFRKLADAHFAVAEPAEDDHRRRQHDGKDGIANGDIGKRHGMQVVGQAVPAVAAQSLTRMTSIKI